MLHCHHRKKTKMGSGVGHFNVLSVVREIHLIVLGKISMQRFGQC